jgi:hypothetical protein
VPENRFDAETHTYWHGPVRLSSVTEIMAPIIDYSMVPEAALEYARDRGTAVHLACHLDDIEVLDEASVAPVVIPRLQAWRKFKRDFQAEIVISEEPAYLPTLLLAGTPDKVMTLRVARKRPRVLIDIKNVATMAPATGVQLSGYEFLLDRARGITVEERYGVQLRADATYAITRYGNELPTFMSLLTLHNWRRRHAA